MKFVKKYKNFFDVVILDLSDPWGPAKKVISVGFYRDIKRSLRKGGLISVQGGCFFYQVNLVAAIFKRLKKVFSSVVLHGAPVLLYGVGELNFTVASDANLKKLSLKELEKRFKRLKLDLKYYRPKIHLSSAVLPKHLMRKIKVK